MPLFYSEKKFFDAVRQGDIALVQKYMGHDLADYNANTRDKKDSTPLHHAARYGQFDMCLFLLEHGADPNARNTDNCTPMALCMYAHNAEKIVDALLKAGADPSVGDAMTTPLYTAISADQPAIVKKFLEAGAKPDNVSHLNRAINNGSATVVHLLLDHGADPVAKSEYNVTPLHCAAQRGMTEIAKRLIASGADMNARDLHSGGTPLHDAAQGSSAEMVELLLTQGADATIRNDGDDTPPSLARKSRKPSVINAFKNFEKQQKGAEKPAQKKEKTAYEEQWVRMGEAKIAHVSTHFALGRRLTEIFNFESCDRMIVSENLKTGAETATPPERFEDIGGTSVQKAIDAFTALGGHVHPNLLDRHLSKPMAEKKQLTAARPFQG